MNMMLLFAADLERTISELSFQSVAIGSLIIVSAITVALFTKERWPKLNLPLFAIIAGTTLLTTMTLIISTVYLNTKSYQGGPVHWHADIEYWACGNQMEIRDPTGTLSNKIGTPTLHEHNDQRIHLEGVPISEHDASLQKFQAVIGGKLTPTELELPLNRSASDYFEDFIDGDGPTSTNPAALQPYITDVANGSLLSMVNGNKCGDNEPAELQIFRFRLGANNTYVQEKMDISKDIIIRDESEVPPGDCYIVEFDKVKDYTDKLCEQFGVRDQKRCEEFGVKADQRDVCKLNDVTEYGELESTSLGSTIEDDTTKPLPVEENATPETIQPQTTPPLPQGAPDA